MAVVPLATLVVAVGAQRCREVEHRAIGGGTLLVALSEVVLGFGVRPLSVAVSAVFEVPVTVGVEPVTLVTVPPTQLLSKLEVL